jgi:hypothetical protein
MEPTSTFNVVSYKHLAIRLPDTRNRRDGLPTAYNEGGCWSLVSGHWFLVSGIWFLVSGIWFLVQRFCSNNIAQF